MDENETQNLETSQAERESSIKKHFFTVTPLSKYLAMLLFVTLPFLGFWLGLNFQKEIVEDLNFNEYSNSEMDVSESDVITDEFAEEGKAGTQSNFKFDETTRSYSDLETGISFEYPAVWGEINVKDEFANCDESYTDPCNQRIYLFEELATGGEIFLVMETLGHQDNPVGRGGFWGDAAGEITTSYIDDCEKQRECTVITNDNGVLIAKTQLEVFDWGDGSPIENIYDVYSELGPYYGVRLSPLRIKNAYDGIEQAFEDVVISSINLFEH